MQFVYGPDGARLKKLAGTTILYLGPDIEIAGGQTVKYLPGDARRAGLGATTWLHRDQLGSVRVETDNAGAVAWRANYRPYGERLVSLAGVAEAKAFIGERQDDETGLLYLNARYYDPVLARFVQADPSNPADAGVGVNRYAYAGNSPVMLLDPTGLAGVPQFNSNVVYPAGGGGPVAFSVNTAAISIGGYVPYDSGWDNYVEPAWNLALYSVQPYLNAYQNFVVSPFQYGLSALARSPLGDPGLYASLQGIGASGAVFGGIGQVGAYGLRALAGVGEPTFGAAPQWQSARRPNI